MKCWQPGAATPQLGPRNAGSWPSSPWPPREVHVWLEEKVGAGPRSRNGIAGRPCKVTGEPPAWLQKVKVSRLAALLEVPAQHPL